MPRKERSRLQRAHIESEDTGSEERESEEVHAEDVGSVSKVTSEGHESRSSVKERFSNILGLLKKKDVAKTEIVEGSKDWQLPAEFRLDEYSVPGRQSYDGKHDEIVQLRLDIGDEKPTFDFMQVPGLPDFSEPGVELPPTYREYKFLLKKCYFLQMFFCFIKVDFDVPLSLCFRYGSVGSVVH